MQNVLGFSPIQTGLAYLPVTVAVGFAAGVSTQLLYSDRHAADHRRGRAARRQRRLLAVTDPRPRLLPTGPTPRTGSHVDRTRGGHGRRPERAANAGVSSDKAGLAAALITASSTLATALGLAILTAIATSRNQHLLTAHAAVPDALTSGFHRALVACSISLLIAAAIAARAINTRGQPEPTHGSSPADQVSTTRDNPPDDRNSGLTLRHHDLPNPELRDAHQVAWQTYLARLVIRAEGGDPGADPTPSRWLGSLLGAPRRR